MMREGGGGGGGKKKTKTSAGCTQKLNLNILNSYAWILSIISSKKSPANSPPLSISQKL
jgi:hypothetical protein